MDEQAKLMDALMAVGRLCSLPVVILVATPDGERVACGTNIVDLNHAREALTRALESMPEARPLAQAPEMSLT
jgi:hypothetical protein